MLLLLFNQSFSGAVTVGGQFVLAPIFSGAAFGAAKTGGVLESDASISGQAYGRAQTGGAFQAPASFVGGASVPESVTVGGFFGGLAKFSAGVVVAEQDLDGGPVVIIVPPRRKKAVIINAPAFMCSPIFSGKAKGIQQPTAEEMALALLLLR